MLIISTSEEKSGLAGYTSREFRRILHDYLKIVVPAINLKKDFDLNIEQKKDLQNTILIGTPENNPAIKHVIEEGFIEEPDHEQGYIIKCAPMPGKPKNWLFVVAGKEDVGTLYALRDIEHYHLEVFKPGPGGLLVEPFEKREKPAIEYRGHWTWGCNMPDKKAWIENMSKWKLNELIHWDNYLPKNGKEYVDFAHERGVRVVWGFGWGWMPFWNFDLPEEFDSGVGEGVEMCPSSDFNNEFFQREILKKITEDYSPTGCDGIYFQAFTECPKCECPKCNKKTMGELMLDFINSIVSLIKKDFPDLWISCGIHHDFGDYSYLKNLDNRCNLFWENCTSGTSVRGNNEDFGYISKTIPYGHGYSETCPADPPYTENSLKQWMKSNAKQYEVEGGIRNHYKYMSFLQDWTRKFTEKPSDNKHGSMIADHSVFCRRTPFPLIALAEAQWNPDSDTEFIVDHLLSFLGIKDKIKNTTETGEKLVDTMGMPPWVYDKAVEREGHSE